jgi:methyl-accepting chemotaxis protein
VLDRLQDIEEKAEYTATRVQHTRDALQQVASAFASVAHTTVSIEGGLQRGMRATSDHLIKNFAILFDGVSRLTAESKGLAEMFAEQMAQFDLSKLELRPPISPQWSDPPKLPQLRKFTGVDEAVAYIYSLVPKLQGYLSAVHKKLGSVDGVLPSFADRQETDTSISQLIGAANELQKQVTELQKQIGKMATKGDLASLKRAQTAAAQLDMQTAVGCFRCMACGRDIQQVSGSMSEADAARMLGGAPSLVAVAPQNALPFSPLYGSSAAEAFDTSGIIESPRGIRSFAASSSARRKIQYPVTPPR